MQSVSDKYPEKTSWKATFWAGCERCIQTGKMLHHLAERSRSLGLQLEKHGYRRLIAWPVAPEDDWCLQNEATVCQGDCVLAGAVQGAAVHFREELWMSARVRSLTDDSHGVTARFLCESPCIRAGALCWQVCTVCDWCLTKDYLYSFECNRQTCSDCTRTQRHQLVPITFPRTVCFSSRVLWSQI